MSYALMAGVSYTEAQDLTPGEICDLYIYRRRYDYVLHGIKAGS